MVFIMFFVGYSVMVVFVIEVVDIFKMVNLKFFIFFFVMNIGKWFRFVYFSFVFMGEINIWVFCI